MVQNDCFWHGKLVAPKVWCRVQQSEFCGRLWITSRETLKLRYNFISRCSKADYPYNRRSGNTELKSYHGYGNGQGDIWKMGDTFLIDLLRCSVLWFPQKIRTHFHAVVRRVIVGKVVIYNAIHKGNVNKTVRIAEPWRNEDCSTANLFSLITVSVNENKCVACIDETDISFDCRKCLYQQRRISDNNPF